MKHNIDKMIQMGVAARNNAYAPYSKFLVGACIFSDDGQYYAGCNVENAAYPVAQCAEATAIGNMILNGGKKINAVLVMTDTPNGVFPCGSCLQKLSEFTSLDADVIIANLTGVKQVKKFSDCFNIPFASLTDVLHKN